MARLAGHHDRALYCSSCGCRHVFKFELCRAILVLATIYAAVAASWSIAGGLGGLLLLGFISFYGVGAYTNGILLTKYGISPWLNIFIAGGVAALLGWLIAAVTLRYELSEDYFAMFTVGVSQVLKLLLS